MPLEVVNKKRALTLQSPLDPVTLFIATRNRCQVMLWPEALIYKPQTKHGQILSNLGHWRRHS